MFNYFYSDGYYCDDVYEDVYDLIDAICEDLEGYIDDRFTSEEKDFDLIIQYQDKDDSNYSKSFVIKHPVDLIEDYAPESWENFCLRTNAKFYLSDCGLEDSDYNIQKYEDQEEEKKINIRNVLYKEIQKGLDKLDEDEREEEIDEFYSLLDEEGAIDFYPLSDIEEAFDALFFPDEDIHVLNINFFINNSDLKEILDSMKDTIVDDLMKKLEKNKNLC